MTLADDVNLEEYIAAKDDLSGADIKVSLWTYISTYNIIYVYVCHILCII